MDEPSRLGPDFDRHHEVDPAAQSIGGDDRPRLLKREAADRALPSHLLPFGIEQYIALAA
jgi:hypothetical protein